MKSVLQIQPISGKDKLPQVVTSLLAVARGLGAGAQLPPFRLLCEHLQVAKGTLDRALSQLEARGVIERRQGSGIYVTARISQKTVGLVMGEDVFRPGVSPVYLELIEACSRRASERNEQFVFYVDIEGVTPRAGNALMHKDLEEALRLRSLDGLILVSRSSLAQEDKLRDAGIPFVVSGHNSPHEASVEIDLRMITERGVDLLQRKGCRRIAHVGPWEQDAEYFRRYATARGIHFAPEWVMVRSELKKESEGSMELNHEAIGYRAMQRLIAHSAGLPDGVISANDMMTRGICLAMHAVGLVPGKDIQIVTHANKGSITLAEWVQQIDLFEVDPKENAEALFSLLETLMKQELKGRTVVYVRPQLRSS